MENKTTFPVSYQEILTMVGFLPKEKQDQLIEEIRHMQRIEVRSQLQVGSVVKINHHKIPASNQFRVIKINPKNVKVEAINGRMKYSVSPALLEVIG